MPVLRGVVHLVSLAALAAVAVAFGRWLRDPALDGTLAAVVLAAALVALPLRRLYGPGGIAALGGRSKAPRARAGAAADVTAAGGSDAGVPAEPEQELAAAERAARRAADRRRAEPSSGARRPERPAEPVAPEPLWAPVDLNTASAEELCTLPGVGPVAAEHIAAARPFATVDDLARVPGFGPARVRSLRDRLRV